MNAVVSRIGITPVGSEKYRLNRLSFHLLSYAIARNAVLNGIEGRFYVRVDDTDLKRVNRSFLDPYLKVLSELGVNWAYGPDTGDENGNSLFQSERGHLYEEQLGVLANLGLVIQESDGSLLFDVKMFTTQFQDEIDDNRITADIGTDGKVKLDIRSQSDDGRTLEAKPFPIRRSDGTFLFNFTSPVDDGLLGITHAVRDRDKIDLLAKQEMVRTALGFPQVKYIHAPLLVNRDGKRYVEDEQYGDVNYQNFLANGYMPRALVSYLLSGFYGPSEQFYGSIDEFASVLRVNKIHRPNVVFSKDVLQKHNRTAISRSTDEEYLSSLKRYLGIVDPQTAEMLEGNRPLGDSIAKLRRSFMDARQFIIDLTSDEPREIDPSLLPLSEALVALRAEHRVHGESKSFSQSMSETGKMNAEALGMDYSTYTRGVIQILIGRDTKLPLSAVVEYFDRAGELDSRLNTWENAVIEGQIDRGRLK